MEKAEQGKDPGTVAAHPTCNEEDRSEPVAVELLASMRGVESRDVTVSWRPGVRDSTAPPSAVDSS